jgi:hypothetical protein
MSEQKSSKLELENHAQDKNWRYRSSIDTDSERETKFDFEVV